MEKIAKHDSWPIQPDILGPPLDLRPVDIGGRWGHGWRSTRVVHLVCGFVVRRLGFGLPLRRSLLSHFRTEQGHCSACRKKWRLTMICVFVARPRRCLTLSNPVPDKTEWRLISATLCGKRRRMHSYHSHSQICPLAKGQ